MNSDWFDTAYCCLKTVNKFVYLLIAVKEIHGLDIIILKDV